MKQQPAITIAGATGMLGAEIVAALNERKFPCGEVRLCASPDSEGELYGVCGEQVAVEVLDQAALEGMDIVFLAAPENLAAEQAQLAAAGGAFVISGADALRRQDEIPLIIPTINGDLLSTQQRMIASPAAAVVSLALVLKEIGAAAGLRRVVVVSCEAVSDEGRSGLDELWDQTRAVFTQGEIRCERFPQQIAFNCIPQVGDISADGDSAGELALAGELRHVLALPELRIAATVLRMPVLHGHAQSVAVETESDLPPAQLCRLLEDAPGIRLWDVNDAYPTPLRAAGSDEVHVGRVRADRSVSHGVQFWVVADNLRTGAALNMVQIAEELVRRFGT